MKVKLYSDGATRGNPDGPGGYGIIIQFIDDDGKVQEKEFSAGFPKTTNNRMELLGVITGLEALKKFCEACEVLVVTDSQYVTNAFNKGWLQNWMKNGWKTADNKSVKNLDLWQRLLKALKPHQVTFEWVRGHCGDELNERCDKLATEAADKMREPEPEIWHDKIHEEATE